MNTEPTKHYDSPNQLLPPGGVTPGGTGNRGAGPVVLGVWEIGLMGERGTGDGGMGVETRPGGISYSL